MPATGRTKAEQRAATTRALVLEARRVFAARGYAHASLTEIVTAAGVTKGALYHHFPGGKDELFRVVLGQVHREVADRVATAAPEADPWTQLIAGCRAFLTATTEPELQQVMLLDAPAVLGWGVWRELDAASSMQHLEAILLRLIADEVIAAQPVRPLVHLLSGAMNEAALWLASSDQPDRDLTDTMSALSGLVQSLRTHAGSEDPGRPATA